MANYEFVGTLKSGNHYVLDLDKAFHAGDEVPLTKENVESFAHRFDNIHPVKVETVKAADDDSKSKTTGKK